MPQKLGAGESNSQRSVSYGDGIYRSDDGGKDWKNLGLKKSEHIGRVVIDPRDSKVVYVAAAGPLWGPGGDRGLFKTIDAGILADGQHGLPRLPAIDGLEEPAIPTWPP